MEMKQCTYCGKVKQLEHFAKQTRGLHGRTSKCKACASLYNKEYHAARFSSDLDFRKRKLENAKQWSKNNPEKRAAIAKRRNLKEKQVSPDKVKCRALVNQRVRFGRIPKAKELRCEHCGRQAAHYHHYLGYSFEHRYSVIPLCTTCHALQD